MGLQGKPPLEPVVKGINTKSGHRYAECKAIVELEVSDGNGGRKDMIIEYPMQGERHLCALMHENKVSAKGFDIKEDVSHSNMQEISAVLKDIIKEE